MTLQTHTAAHTGPRTKVPSAGMYARVQFVEFGFEKPEFERNTIPGKAIGGQRWNHAGVAT